MNEVLTDSEGKSTTGSHRGKKVTAVCKMRRGKEETKSFPLSLDVSALIRFYYDGKHCCSNIA